MKRFFEIISEHGVRPVNFVEVGSRDGLHAKQFADIANVNDVTIVEASPVLADKIWRAFPEFRVWNVALSNKEGEAKFHDMSGQPYAIRRGLGSLHDRDVYSDPPIIVPTFRGDTFMMKFNYTFLSAIKIDVEGHAYEVLEGFGEALNDRILSLHVEAEMVPIWKDQRLWPEVKALLEGKGWKLAYFEEYNHPTTQCDSIWINS